DLRVQSNQRVPDVVLQQHIGGVAWQLASRDELGAGGYDQVPNEVSNGIGFGEAQVAPPNTFWIIDARKITKARSSTLIFLEAKSNSSARLRRLACSSESILGTGIGRRDLSLMPG